MNGPGMSVIVSERTRFARFAVAGGIAAGVNVASRWVFSIGMVYELAIALAYGAGMATAFALNRTFVFDRPEEGVFGQFSPNSPRSMPLRSRKCGWSVGLARFLLPWIGWRWEPKRSPIRSGSQARS